MYRNLYGVGRVATQELKDYRRACEMFALENHAVMKKLRAMISGKWKDFEHYKVDYFFVFKRERLYNKQGGIKKLDVANRIKAVQDCLFASIGIDDKSVWASSIEKMCGEVEACHIVMHPHTPINATELMEMFEGSQDVPTMLS